MRVVLGLGLIGLAVSGVTPWGYLGVIPVLSGLVGNCPLYDRSASRPALTPGRSSANG